jgi:hypothetical protein
MQDSDVPSKFPIPWANSAGSSYIRPIPTASQIGIQNGAASLTDGFPPLNALPIASGGVPPFMQDHNGILNQATAWLRWDQAGGPVYYDGTFSSAIGGYPKGTQLMSSVTNGLVWINQVDNNTTNPDSGGSNWTSIYAQTHTWTAAQTFNANVQVNASQAVTGNLAVGGAVDTQVIDGRGGTLLNLLGGSTGFQVANHANTAASLIVADNGTVTVPRGALLAQAGVQCGSVSNPIANQTSGFQALTSGTQIYASSGTAFAVGTGSGALVGWFWGNTAIGSVSTNGASTSYNTTSDYRIKDITGLTDGTPLSSLPVRFGTFKTAPNPVAQPMFLAHELAEVAPYAVTGTKDAVDAEGKPVLQQVDHSALVPLLLAYTQSLEKRIAVLEAKVTLAD